MSTVTAPTLLDVAYALTTCPQFVTFTGRNAEWEYAHIPRTDRPVKFYALHYCGVGLRTFAVASADRIPTYIR